ncbi:hypothetical protein [Lichenihabitans psoromatis]|uniref:hypothetical protein n=1 Tax=Lichenihabitans psoromatis TaxID=2528642 RepID=UPI001035ED21|nr:hypothetical protein [Lichenihabitans psoromatis]
MTLTCGQVKAARLLLKWSINGLASRSNLKTNAIVLIEARDSYDPISAIAEKSLQRVFRAAGIEFVNGEQPGVRITEPT